ncbi:glycosyl hydrolase 53 family protein [Klebsiella pneumoniae]|uniref:glycosyl hydrolase 53 family protein n=1 Tax=Klebsiella pneumoniae TaxID=573 RepID=UPI00133055B0|nr:glycosyl hydrolase 53 family protein [Klebsiella pneumoniae]MCM6064979.1 glycosyl hydrolase 53 family protein [Klebsiella pneumoniae]MDG0549954.1 glycosyl hydrolase 53 family protein [Klebsiella pneumoniae]HBQ2992391.1 glycosyl hydrolase 53 family protein [Klebsiella pneumoniae]
MKRFTPAWLAVCLACSFSTSSLAADALATRAFQGMPADFIKGADISTLLDAEKHGATFYDQNNQRKDPIAILKENGVNYVRLRLWVDPQSASSEDYGGGNNDLATTLANCDNAENSFQAKEEKDGGYPASVQGQYNYIHDLMQAVVDVPDQRGKGIFYWEPTWIAVPGNTWATPAGMKYIHDEWKEGNARENQALFDCQGKVLPSVKVFN